MVLSSLSPSQSPDSQNSTIHPPDVTKRVLATSLTTGKFSDTAYSLYSRRTSEGNIGYPRVLYVNSDVLKAAGEYFVAQLAGGFDTNRRLEKDTSDYAYDDDSDIEDFEDSGIISGEDNDEVTVGAGGEKKIGDATGKDTEREAAQDLETGMAYNVAVPDVAFATWRALVYYIHTGKVTFAPLRSQGVSARTQAIKDHRMLKPHEPSLCSSKSMYRAADIVGLDKLKTLAQEHLHSILSSETIVDETFSVFSSLYPEVLDMQLRYLYDRNLISEAIPVMRRKLLDIANAGLSQAVDVKETIILQLFKLLDKKKTQTDISYKKMSPVSVKPAQAFKNPAVESAVIASLSTGIFSDTAYWLHSRRLANGKIGVPRVVHGSSAVIKMSGDYFANQFGAGITNASAQPLQGETDTYGYDEDSDIEDAEDEHIQSYGCEFNDVLTKTASFTTTDTLQDNNSVHQSVSNDPINQAPLLTRVEDGNTRAAHHVVIQDVASKTWQSLIYYIYTGIIEFAPLKSQGRAVRSTAIAIYHKHNPVLPVPCSPKSMYRLATIVKMPLLKTQAQDEIKKQLSARNIVDEVFSRFSSSYHDILKMELDILYKNALMSQVMPAIHNRMFKITEGQVSHAGNALNFMLDKLSESLLLDGPQSSDESDGSGISGSSIPRATAVTEAMIVSSGKKKSKGKKNLKRKRK